MKAPLILSLALGFLALTAPAQAKLKICLLDFL